MNPDARILLVAPQPFFTVAGTPLNVLEMCRALTGSGFEVHLATLPMGETVALPRLIYHRVPQVFFLRHVPIGFSFGKMIYDVLLAFAVIRLLHRQLFLAVHAIEEAVFFSVPIARWFGVPAIADLDSDLVGQLRANPSAAVRLLATPAGMLRRYALRRATCAITVAPALTRLVAEISPKTPVFEIADVAPAALLRPPDPNAIADLRRELGLGQGPVIVYTGNFDRRQGVEALVDAVPGVLARFADAVLLLVGGEPEQVSRLRSRAERLGVENAVQFAGRRPLEEMPEFMGLAAVLVSPRVEPLVTPLKIYAYMASGKPIVATDLPTHTNVLDEASAILVEPTAEGLARGIAQALADPARGERLGREARRRAEQHHTSASLSRKLADAYAFIERIAPASTSPRPGSTRCCGSAVPSWARMCARPKRSRPKRRPGAGPPRRQMPAG
jgi:glycosyltransferase involved in cell wall biosynthesis